jgi:hypothetical protein
MKMEEPKQQQTNIDAGNPRGISAVLVIDQSDDLLGGTYELVDATAWTPLAAVTSRFSWRPTS